MTNPSASPAPAGGDPYADAKDRARSADPAVRAALGQDAGAPREVLYYLSADPDPQVRRAVAGNLATPVQVSPALARDPDEAVRAILAEKLARILPQLEASGRQALVAMAHQALAMLAADRLVQVRAAVATALADVAYAPPEICRALARDAAQQVAEPLLKACMALTEGELMAILASRGVECPWVPRAIAARPDLTPEMADALAQSGDGETAATLAANGNAPLSDQAFAHLLGQSRTDPSLREALAARVGLPARLDAAVAQTLGREVQATLAAQASLDGETLADVLAVVRRRLAFAADPLFNDPRRSPSERAVLLHRQGRLTEDTVWDALAWGERAFVVTALARLARLEDSLVERILATQSARAVTALCWRAGLSMRCARAVQAKAAFIPPTKILNARNGVDYPLTPSDMRWQLDLFGIEDA